MHLNLNTTMHRITPVQERHLDARQAERLALPTFVPHEHPPKPMGRTERIGHRVAELTALASMFAVGVMAWNGWLPCGCVTP